MTDYVSTNCGEERKFDIEITVGGALVVSDADGGLRRARAWMRSALLRAPVRLCGSIKTYHSTAATVASVVLLGTAAPTTAILSASPTATPAPSASPAPTTECLVDEFEGTSLGSQWTADAGGDGSYVVADGHITFSDASHVRSVDSFATPLIIRATLDKTDDCSNHYIKLSTEPWDEGGYFYEPGVVTFSWWCGYREIIGQTKISDSTNCAKERMYDIEITVDGSTVTWSDAEGACDELVLQDAIGSSERLYVYVGADTGMATMVTAWHSVEICRSLMTASPTASPSLVSPVAKRRSKAEATLIVPIAVGLSFAVVACALFIGIRRKLRKLRKPAKAPITSGPAAAEAHAPSAAARLRPRRNRSNRSWRGRSWSWSRSSWL